ncbi:MAG: sugar phosphate isomerase/epimerase [Armatimonadetes bacterium]|nr:sugar phosphate isomerase/epimerase [Armatimonadota bacterium]MDE2205391.1 sugar phosphate isomerase/epimerase [Armatimonadota bacterium]
MYKALAPHAIGMNPVDLETALKLAAESGFQGLELNARDIASRVKAKGSDSVKSLFHAAGVVPAAFGFTVDIRAEEDAYRVSVGELASLASACASVGCLRTGTWILSGSNELDFSANRDFHLKRLTPVATVLADCGVRLALEFLGPLTIRERFTHPFVCDLAGMLELAHDVSPNTGLLLDAWHWYTSHGTLESLRALTNENVVMVHVNDAPVGVEIDAQVDNTRALPGETGVIDIAGFLKALDAAGYDGPVTPEPFKRSLSELPSDSDRAQLVGSAMDAIFRSAGVTPIV